LKERVKENDGIEIVKEREKEEGKQSSRESKYHLKREELVPSSTANSRSGNMSSTAHAVCSTCIMVS
jgi:hypothetical protein